VKREDNRAIADFEAALRLDPNNTYAKNGLANVRQAQQQQNQPQALNVDLGTLMKEIDNNTARANQLYNNKTIRTTGMIHIIENDHVWLSRGGYYMDLPVYFNSSERAKLLNLNKGQRITIRGVYDGSRSNIRNAVIE